MSSSGVSALRPPPWFAPAETAAYETVPEPAGPQPGAGPLSRLRRALERDPATPAVALVVAWSGLLVLLWAAVLGAALGALVAAGVVTGGRTARLFHVAGASGLRPWHLADGLLAGAGGTVVAAGGAVFGSVLGVAAWLGIGLLVAAAGLAAQWRLEAGILRTCGYRRPSAGELRRISAAAQRAGSPVTGPGTGEFLVLDSDTPMVRAFVDHLGISTGALECHGDEELAALLCRAFWLRAAGAGLRRSVVAACGWPVLALDALGRRLHGPSVPGVVRAAIGLVLWPAHLLAALVRAVARPGRVADDYGADAAAGTAGLGPALVSVLEGRATGDAGAGPLRDPAGGAAATALRVERLEPRRPLDAFFAPPAPARTRRSARYGWATLAAPGTAVLVALGAWLSAGAGGGPGDVAAATAASYTVSFLDASFHRPQVHRVIEAAVAPATVPAVERQADSSPWGVAAALVAGARTSSRATALACAAVPAGAVPGADVRVAVRVRWAYAVDGRARRVVVTELVPLRLVGGRWAPTAAPSPQPAGPSVPAAAFGPCPA